MKIAPIAVSLLLAPTLVFAQSWSAGLNDATLRSVDGDFHFHPTKINLRSDDRDMEALVRKTAPSVVMIEVTGRPVPVEDDDSQDLEEQLRKLFPHGEPSAPSAPAAPAQPKMHQEHGVGSGVIVSLGGRVIIVTNAHVVSFAGTGDSVKLKYDDGSTGDGTILGYNERYDLGFIQPKALPRAARAMPLNTGALQRGQTAVAIGSPFALDQTVTKGIISYLGRDISGQEGENGQPNLDLVADFIQTDAAINPGNSGGALVDRNGHLIGINTSIISRSGSSSGIGFATPAKYIIHVAARYAATGVISPSRIGLMVSKAVLDDQGKPKLDQEGKPVIGALTVAKEPEAGTPAAAAGFKKGDAIVSVDGRAVSSSQEFLKMITDKVPSRKVMIVVRRNGQTLTIASDVASTHD